MKLDIGGEETIQATVEQLWSALNDPLVLTRCIPGCKTMTEIAPDNYKVDMQLRVARRDLVEYAAQLAVDVAETRIKRTITHDDQLRLADRYAAQLTEAR